MKMRNKKKFAFLLFLLVAAGASAQGDASAPADEYNALKSLVVLALMLIGLVFLYRSSRRKAADKTPAVAANDEPDAPVPDEVVATIVMMLNDMDEDVHDRDNTVLTIRKVTRNYSPWNSKLLGMRQLPTKK
jgi:cbb3-type cytochrome oxidase subunit 3